MNPVFAGAMPMPVPIIIPESSGHLSPHQSSTMMLSMWIVVNVVGFAALFLSAFFANGQYKHLPLWRKIFKDSYDYTDWSLGAVTLAIFNGLALILALCGYVYDLLIKLDS